MAAKFTELGKTSDVIETGSRFDGPKKVVPYTRSEIYLEETLENVCAQLLDYNIHKERKDSTRFARGISSTFSTLEGLVERGVKVDIGMPKELWKSPSAEITELKQQCERLLENHNEVIEQWYWGDRKQSLLDYLCRERVLKKDQQSCLDEGNTSSSPVPSSDRDL